MADPEQSEEEKRALPKRGILFRLSASETPEKPVDQVESIIANLRSVLNADRGIAPSCLELGLSLHQMLSDWNERRPAILAEIKAAVETYEPRLTEVEVTALGQTTTSRLSLLIEATLPDGQTLRIQTNMAASGAAEVERLVQRV